MPANSNLNPKTPDFDPVDVHIGLRLRALRIERKLSQGQVGEQIGVTFQQVQKFERAHNRITAKRLKQLSQVLGTSLDYFFEGVEVKGNSLVVDSDQTMMDLMRQQDSFQLLNAFYQIEDAARRQAVLELIRKLGPDPSQAHT